MLSAWPDGSPARASGSPPRRWSCSPPRGSSARRSPRSRLEAGLTERTFYRYYADKPEVLFAGQAEFEGLFLEGLDDAGSTRPMELVASALDHAATFFPDERRSWSRSRQAVVAGNVALQERELHKMSALADALTSALVQRDVDPTGSGAGRRGRRQRLPTLVRRLDRSRARAARSATSSDVCSASCKGCSPRRRRSAVRASSYCSRLDRSCPRQGSNLH
jgi:AcrR family transcriptional regulator